MPDNKSDPADTTRTRPDSSRAEREQPLSPSSADAAPSLLRAGASAPEFTLPKTPDERVSLSDYRGQPVILAFYPADWSPVCGDQLGLYNELLGEFQRFGAALIGISVDGAWCHAAFSQARHFGFPLLADFEPKGKVSRTYGAYNTDAGMSNRALFVIDRDGTIRWSYLSPMGVNPGADGILRALESLEPADRAPSATRAATLHDAGAGAEPRRGDASRAPERREGQSP